MVQRFQKGHAESTWIYVDCEASEASGVTFNDIRDVGIPICLEYGREMEVVSEEWKEDIS